MLLIYILFNTKIPTTNYQLMNTLPGGTAIGELGWENKFDINKALFWKYFCTVWSRKKHSLMIFQEWHICWWFTWLSRPIKKSIRKNRTDHSGDHGIWLTAEGYTRNAKPGPMTQKIVPQKIISKCKKVFKLRNRLEMGEIKNI